MIGSLNAPAQLSTPRLLLRKPRQEDAAPLFRSYASDGGIVRFVSWRVHETEGETLGFLRQCLDEWSNGTGYPYVIEVVDGPPDPVGMIHLHRRPHAAEFGYVIAQPYWGQGYTTEALSALVDWSLDQPEVWRAQAFCDVENLASARVMEKAGMTFEGVLRRFFVHPNISPEPRDCRMYAKVRT